MKRENVFLLARLLGLVLMAALSVGAACSRATPDPAKAPERPSVRLYVLSTVAGALEPCGCQKDMLGGVDHAAALLRSQKEKAPNALVLGAGPMLFMDPVLEGQKRRQDEWKAEALAHAFRELPVAAWAPGANDFAAGAGRLAELSKTAGAALVSANLGGDLFRKHAIFEVGGHKVGVTGAGEPRSPAGTPDGVAIGPLEGGLREGLAALKEAGANVLVALVSTDRGEALRLAEKVPGFDVIVVGKAFDRGEGNDAPFSPVIVDGTLVVQAPNHLQGVAVVDLYVKDGYDFVDGSGIALAEKRESLQGRIAELERRLGEWERNGAAKTDLDARRADLGRLRGELAALAPPSSPAGRSYVRYELLPVKEAAGTDPGVARRMLDYYRRVNDHNREAFKDRKPPPVPEGGSRYLGVEACANCHEEEVAFWKGTPHSKAYETLTTQHKEFNLDCVSCHVTGYEKPGGTTVTHVEGLTAVQCEACHGPGSRHEDDTSDLTKIVRRPDPALCTTCHHVPHVAETWSAEKAWSHIVGPGHGQPAVAR